MTNISELDLQNLRHLIGGFDTTHCKMQRLTPRSSSFLKKAQSPLWKISSSL